MDKNIAAFIRDNAKTIGVRFFRDYRENEANKTISLDLGSQSLRISDKEYTYVTELDFNIGDMAIVVVAEVPKVVIVTRVDEALEISHNDDTQYKWVVCKVDMEQYKQTMGDNMEITKTLAKSYQKSMKNSFRQVLLSNLAEDEQAKILAITSPSTIVKTEGEVK